MELRLLIKRQLENILPSCLLTQTIQFTSLVGITKQILVWLNDIVNSTKIISADLIDPLSMFVTNIGDIYILNGGSNRRVDRWISSTNTFVNVMNVDPHCDGLFADINDTLYCSLFLQDQVMKRWLNDDVMTLHIAAGTGTRGSALNELYGPLGMFVDINFALYVADCNNHRIQLFQSGQSNGKTLAGNGAPNTINLHCPHGLILDANKYLFINDRTYP